MVGVHCPAGAVVPTAWLGGMASGDGASSGVADEAGVSGGVRGWPGARVALPGVGGSVRAGAWLVEVAPELVERVAAAGCSGKVSDPSSGAVPFG